MTSKPLIPWTVGAGHGMGIIELDDDGRPVCAHLYKRDHQADGTYRTVNEVLIAHGLDVDHIAAVLIDGKRNSFGLTFGGDFDELATWLETQRPELTREDPDTYRFD